MLHNLICIGSQTDFDAACQSQSACSFFVLPLSRSSVGCQCTASTAKVVNSAVAYCSQVRHLAAPIPPLPNFPCIFLQLVLHFQLCYSYSYSSSSSSGSGSGSGSSLSTARAISRDMRVSAPCISWQSVANREYTQIVTATQHSPTEQAANANASANASANANANASTAHTYAFSQPFCSTSVPHRFVQYSRTSPCNAVARSIASPAQSVSVSVSLRR